MDIDAQTLAAVCVLNERPSFWISVYNYMVQDHNVDPEQAISVIDAFSSRIIARPNKEYDH